MLSESLLQMNTLGKSPGEELWKTIPYLLVVTVLTLNGGWILLGPVVVITRVRGTHAALTDLKTAKETFDKVMSWTIWFKQLPDRIKMVWERSVETVVLTIVILLVLYITFQTFFRRIVISTFYGRRRKTNKSKAWYLIMSVMTERRKLFWIRREYITIAIELDADEKN